LPRVIKLAQLSFSAKLSLSLLTLAFGLLTILFVLIIPKMQKEQYDYKIKQVEQTIALNTQELKMAADYINTYGRLNSLKIKENLEHELYKIEDKITLLDYKSKKNFLINKSSDLQCNLKLLDNPNSSLFNQNTNINNGEKEFLNKELIYDKWQVFRKKNEKTLCPSITTHIVFAKKIKNKNSVLLSCNTDTFYNRKDNVEIKIKKYIQKSFSYTQNIHKGNTFVMWINVNSKEENKPLYNKNDKSNNEKYCISKLSNVNSIKTGLLSAEEILQKSNKEPIRHLMDKPNDQGNYKYKAITWVRSINNHENKRLMFITTVYEEDLNNNIDSVFWKILPASLLALIFSIFTGFLLFRKSSKSLDILVKTSKEVRLGNFKLRSNIKGKDQIAILGHTFDLMLDSMQNNIKNLDSKVEYRTKELQKSLDEKSVLLKEIHHRVKNNLAFTINLIKLQKRKIDDEKTKELFTDVEERIYIMELLHRKLYESKDLNSIPFKKYIQELVQDIIYAYNVKDLSLKLDIDDIFMDIEHALPCGLVINECITNSIKYAFGSSDNKFSIRFKKLENMCTLEIWDNGKGLDKDLDINKTKSLGLKLITSISKGQLLGDIKYLNENGAKFIIKFEI